MDSSPGSKVLEPSLPRAAAPSSSSSTTTAGVKRPAPSLLPAFEPLSSSPVLPRPTKRRAREREGSNARSKYPTPVPTSSTGILSSSPPRVGAGAGRPALQRTQSTVSERAPLSAVPSIELNENGETLLMGRSSNSSHYQLSSNRLISRVHVKARYIPATAPLEPNKMEIVCNGWNGLKLHCQGRTWELARGDTFTSETESAEIMLDVQDARVLVHWPKKDRHESLANLSDSSWDDSPRSRAGGGGGGVAAPGASALLQSSPLRRTTRITSPESPTPGTMSAAAAASLQSLLPGLGDDPSSAGAQIHIYEDGSADEQDLPEQTAAAHGASFATEVTNSFSSDLSEPQSDDDDHENDPNEENDPIIHSFGPFGANISNRFASFSTLSPNIRPPISRLSSSGDSTAVASAAGALRDVSSGATSKPSSAKNSPKPGAAAAAAAAAATASASRGGGGGAGARRDSITVAIPAHINVGAITHHLINQLAFSRLSSSPLSSIMNNLPAEEKKDLSRDELRRIIESTTCVGIIPRQGKDAAGQPLESEYYYIPEMDGDNSRRAAVVDGLRKPSLRNCRKQHKVSLDSKPGPRAEGLGIPPRRSLLTLVLSNTIGRGRGRRDDLYVFPSTGSGPAASRLVSSSQPWKLSR